MVRSRTTEKGVRTEVAGFLVTNLLNHPRSRIARYRRTCLRDAANPALRRKPSAAAGWLAPHWPKEYGGPGMIVTAVSSSMKRWLLHVRRAPGATMPQLIGPVLIIHGTEEQKAAAPPEDHSGRSSGARAILSPVPAPTRLPPTRAVRDGDDYIINGRRSGRAARTTPTGSSPHSYESQRPSNRGISMFLSISIARDNGAADHHMANAMGLCEVFFEDVRVPARNLVVKRTAAVYVSATLLDFERSNIGAHIGARNNILDLVQYIKRRAGRRLVDEQVRRELRRSPGRSGGRATALLPHRHTPEARPGPNYEASITRCSTQSSPAA